MSFIKKLPLPERFLNIFPLYIGVELILGISILNKLSGFYGILSIFTGHPLDFVQWLLYISSILVVPFYIEGLKNILKPKVLQFSPIVIFFSLDTLVSFLFIIVFAAQWLYHEDVTIEKVPGQDYTKSATQRYEYGLTSFVTLGVMLARIYFTLVIVNFYKKLIKFHKINDENIIENDSELDLKNKSKWKQWLYKVQYESYKYLKGKI